MTREVTIGQAEAPHTIYLWFSDIGTIRKWSHEPFENGTAYALASVGVDPEVAAEFLSPQPEPAADVVRRGWLGPIPNPERSKPRWVPDDAIVMIAFNPIDNQHTMTWEFAEKRKAPAGDRDWDGCTSFCIEVPVAAPSAAQIRADALREGAEIVDDVDVDWAQGTRENLELARSAILALIDTPAAPDPRDAEIAILREALDGMIAEWEKLTRYGSPMAKAANEAVKFARTALAKAQGLG